MSSPERTRSGLHLLGLVALVTSACDAKGTKPPPASPTTMATNTASQTTTAVPPAGGHDDGIVLHDKAAPALIKGPSVKQQRALAAGQWDSPEQMWEATCGPCHAGGVGPSLFGRGKPVDFLVARARTGHEAMPAFRQSEYSDEDLNRLAEWISKQTPAKPVVPPVVPAAWHDGMSSEEQSEYMVTKVFEPMSKVFKDHDAKRYDAFGCKTCHGPLYLTPTKFLPKLVMKGGKITSFAEKPAVSKWMNDKVVPAMAAAMGQKPYDPTTQTGFGCGGCHAVEMK